MCSSKFHREMRRDPEDDEELDLWIYKETIQRSAQGKDQLFRKPTIRKENKPEEKKLEENNLTVKNQEENNPQAQEVIQIPQMENQASQDDHDTETEKEVDSRRGTARASTKRQQQDDEDIEMKQDKEEKLEGEKPSESKENKPKPDTVMKEETAQKATLVVRYSPVIAGCQLGPDDQKLWDEYIDFYGD